MSIRTKILDEGRIVQEQLIRVLQSHEDAISSGSSTDSSTNTRVTALETTVGKASGTGAGGLAKDVADLEALIGDEETANSILARIKALEDASATQEESP